MTVQTPELLTEHEARRLTERIRLKFTSAAEALDSLGALMQDAYDRRADLALGYESWQAYADAEFSEQTLGLAPTIRRELVSRLTMPQRAIAPALGVSQQAVQQIQQTVARQVTRNLVTSPEPAERIDPGPTVYDLYDPEFERINPATGEVLDVEPYPQLRRAPWPERRDEPVADPTSATTGGGEAPVVAEPRKVTGLDGKQYTRPEPKPQRRRPLTDQARDAGWSLRKDIDRLRAIAADDRFTGLKPQMATHLRGHLQYAIEVCQDLLDRTDTNGGNLS